MALRAAAGIALSEAPALAAARQRCCEEHRARRVPLPSEWSREYAAVGLRAAGLVGDLDEPAAGVRLAPPADARALRPADVPAGLEQLHAHGPVLGVVSNWGSDLPAARTSNGAERIPVPLSRSRLCRGGTATRS